MKTYSLFDANTGLFLDRIVSGPDDWKPAQAPGVGIYEGRVDPLAHRLNLATGDLEPHDPEPPSEDHELVDVGNRLRWRIKPEVAAAREAQGQAQIEIDNLELASQRAMREAVLKVLPANDPVRVRLQAADDAIAALRPAVAIKGRGA